MADTELKDLLEGLFSDIPIETAPEEAPPQGAMGQYGAHASEKQAAVFQAVAEVSRTASSILDLDDLLTRAVDLIHKRFDLYYVGLFLVQDPPRGKDGGPEASKQWAVLRAGTGQAGRIMMEQGHSLEVGGDSSIGWCVAHRQPRIALDVGEAAIRFDNHLLPETRSEMALPLLSRDRILGAMTIQSSQPAAFGQEDIAVFQIMADQLANAVENAHVSQERERRMTELAIVNEIGQAFSSALALDELLETVHLQVSRLFDTTNFYIATYEEGADEWVSAFQIEHGQQQPRARYSVQAGLTGHILRTRQPLLFYSAAELLAFHEAKGREALRQVACSWLGVPLIAADKIVGAMGIQSYAREHLYDEQDLALFSTIAAQVAKALDNLRLLEETRRRAQGMQVINEVGRAITSVLDLDAVLRQIVDITKARFGHYFVSIALVEEDHLVVQHSSTIGDSHVRLEGGQLVIDVQHGRNLIAEAARTRQAVLVHDVLADSRYLPVAELPATRSELTVPIEIKGRVIGVLDVQSDRPFAYGPSDVDLLDSLASQAGVAIENARLHQETQERLRELAILFDCSQYLTGALLRPEEIAEAVAHTLVGLGSLKCTLSLIDRDGDTLRVLADLYVRDDGTIRQEGADDAFRLSEYPATARVMESLEPLVLQVSDPNTDAAELAHMENHEAATLAIVPLALKGKAIGMMELEWREERHHTPQQLNLLRSIASQAATALDNARLLAEAESRAEEQATLRHITEAVSRSLGMQDLLATTLETALGAMGFDAGLVSLSDAETGRLYLACQTGLPEPMVHKFEREGLAGTLCDYVLQKGDILCIDDVRQGAPVDVGGLITHGLRTYAGAPLMYKDDRLGTICFFSRTVREMTAGELSLLEAIGRQIGIGVENARLFEQTQQRLQDLTMLSDVSQALAAAPLQPEEIAEIICRQFVDAMNIEEASVSLLDPEEGTLHTLADLAIAQGRFRAESAVRSFQLADYPATVRVMETLQPLVVHASDPDGDPAELAYMQEFGSLTLTIIPLAIKGEAIGIIELEMSHEERHFTPEELKLATTMANQAAVALDNAGLFAETKAALAESEILYQASRRLASASDFQEIVAAVAEGISQATFNRAVLWDIERGSQGRVEAFSALANWHSGEGALPLPMGTRFPVAQSPVTTLILVDEPLFIEDVQQDKRVDPAAGAELRRQSTRSMAILPLWISRRQVGTLMLMAEEPHRFTASEMRSYRSLAGQMATVIENQSLFQQTQRQLADLATIQTTMAQLTAAATFDEALDAFLPQVANIVQAEAVSMFLVNEEQVIPVGAYSIVERQDLQAGQTLQLGDGPLARKIIETRQPLAFISDDPRLPDQTREAFEAAGVCAAVMIPLIGREDVLGMLSLERHQAGRSFTEHEIGLVQTLADQAATTLEKLRLLEKVQHRTVQLRTAADVSHAASSILDPDRLIQQVVALARERFDLYYAGLFLVDETGEWSGEPGKWAVLRAGTGRAGRRMVEEGHKLEIGGTSMIGSCLADLAPRIALDVGVEAVRFDNPLLPETRSELALPLVSRGHAIGALTIQSEREAAFSSEDIAVFETMADQLANALANALQFGLTESARAKALKRMQELDSLNDIGRKIDETPSIPEFLPWVAKRIPAAMQYPDLCRVAIEFEGLTYGATEAGTLPCQIVESLQVGEDKRGKVYVAYTEDRDFLNEESALLGDIARRVGDYIENQRLFEQARLYAEEQAILRQITEAISRSLQMDELFEATLKTVLAAMDFDAGLVSLSDQDTGHLYLAAHKGLPERMADRLQQEGFSDTLCDFVFKTGETTGIDDVRKGAPVDVTGVIKQELLAYAGAPLTHMDERLGTICFFSRSPRDWTDRELTLLEAIGHQIGVGIENARLYQATQAALAQVEATHRSYLRQGWREYLRQRDMLQKSAFVYDEGRILQSEEAIPVPNLGQPETEQDLAAEGMAVPAASDGEKTGTGLAVPISLRGQPIGVLGVEAPDDDHQWTEDDLALIEAVGDQLGQTLESARLFADTQRRAEQMSTLHRVGMDLSSGLALERVLETLYEQCQQVFITDTFCVALYDEDTELIRFPLLTGVDGTVQLPPQDIRRQPSLTSFVIQSGQPLHVPDSQAVPNDAPYRALPISDLPNRAYLGVPLTARGRVIGVLSVQSRTPNAYTDEDQELLTTIATQASIAIENAQAYEQLMATAEQLREVDRLKTQFLANMSHELRTPLNSIIGFSRVMLKGIDGPLTELQETDLNSIYSSGQHLLSLINSILDMSKIEAGKMDLSFEEVSLHSLFDGALATARGLLKDRPIELRSYLPDDLPSVWADAQRVRQVLFNLVSNAAKFTEVGHITLRAEVAAGFVTISVSDSGIGMEPEAQKRLFIPFQQVDASTTRRAGGTGLGLAICRSYIEMHGGEIWVESEPGKGTTCFFTLPLYQSVQETEAEATEERPDSNRKVVLAIDDDAGVITLLKRYLEDDGYQVIGVRQPHHALETAQRLAPDLTAITLDVVMPNMDGWQVLQALKQDARTRTVPVLLCSIVEGLEQGLGMGAAACLNKPVTRDEVLNALRKVERPAAVIS